MRKILIWKSVTHGNELDIFGRTDYNTVYKSLNKFPGGVCPNWGNKLWFQGLYSTIDTDDNQIYFRSNETVDEINNNFDLIIYPMANIFSVQFADALPSIEAEIKKIKIPVYIIACGAQADSYDDLRWLTEKIGDPSKAFIYAVYETGGAFALRGNFTKSFFEKLGFPNAVVTGCPSMYQLGPELSINYSKTAHNNLKPALNGSIKVLKHILQSNKHAIFFDQDSFFGYLYNPDYEPIYNLKSQALFHRYYDSVSANMLAEHRIKHIIDMADWYWYLKNGGFNYSFGSRIHGSIMSVLSGIPTTVATIDTRTQEIAEFFDIPHIVLDKTKAVTMKQFYRGYDQMDYGPFNQHFKERYFHYEEFLVSHNIVSRINTENSFFEQEGKKEFDECEIVIQNGKKFSEYYNKLRENKMAIVLMSHMFDIKEKLNTIGVNQ